MNGSKQQCNDILHGSVVVQLFDALVRLNRHVAKFTGARDPTVLS